MVGLLHTDVLVVPPLEAVWLEDDLQLRDGRGCLSFEVKGDNDATVLLKQHTGSRRWQHAAAEGLGPPPAAAAAAGGGRASPIEQNYTVILGSHRNSCLKFEKDGELCCMVTNAPGARLSSSCFTRYWINYDDGAISLGRGEPGEELCCCWTDPDPIQHIRFAGLSAWDKHVAYRNLRMHPVLQPPPCSPLPKQARGGGGGGAGDGDDASEPQAATAEQQQRDQQQALSPIARRGLAAQLGGLGSEAPPPSLLQLCQAVLMRSLSAGSVCEVLQVADCLEPVLDGLRRPAVAYAAQQLPALVREDLEGFCALSTSSLADILCCPSLACPEKAVFDGVMLWAGYGRQVEDASSPCHPLEDLDQLLPSIRFPLLQDAELEDVRRHPMWQRCRLLRELLQEAVDARQQQREEEEAGGKSPKAALSRIGQAAGGTGGVAALSMSMRDKRHVRVLTPSERLASTRFQLRRSPEGCTAELLYMYDGDKNGVCWHLGTGGGSQPWVNPVIAGRLQVRASSPACRSTDPKALVGHNFARCNFAGPQRLPSGQLSSWWLMDLGPERRLICTHYTLRHDASSDFLRSWVLQGSNDGGASWADLRRHISDRTLRMPGQYASWAVGSRAAAVPYRAFRLLLVGPNPEATNPHHVCLSLWELYGYLYSAQ